MLWFLFFLFAPLLLQALIKCLREIIYQAVKRVQTENKLNIEYEDFDEFESHQEEKEFFITHLRKD